MTEDSQLPNRAITYCEYVTYARPVRSETGVTRFESYTEGRNHFKDLLDAADRGQLAGVVRDRKFTAVVDGDRLRQTIARLLPADAQVVNEDGAWAVFLPGLPIAAEAVSFDDAINEVVQALREYAEDWSDHLAAARNHSGNWPLVQLIGLSDDEQLRDWLVGGS